MIVMHEFEGRETEVAAKDRSLPHRGVLKGLFLSLNYDRTEQKVLAASEKETSPTEGFSTVSPSP